MAVLLNTQQQRCRGWVLKAAALLINQDGLVEAVDDDGGLVSVARIVGHELKRVSDDGEAKEFPYQSPWLLPGDDEFEILVGLGDGSQLCSEAGFALVPSFSGVDGERLGRLQELGSNIEVELVGPAVVYQQGFDLSLLEYGERGGYLCLPPAGPRARPSALAG